MSSGVELLENSTQTDSRFSLEHDLRREEKLGWADNGVRRLVREDCTKCSL